MRAAARRSLRVPPPALGIVGATATPRRRFAAAGAAIALVVVAAAAQARAESAAGLRPYAVVDDAIPQPLSDAPGDATRGRAIVTNRQVGLCLLCHSGPFPEERFQGTLAPDLAGAGERWSEGQLRLRLVDARRLNPDSIMPAYYRVDHLARVGSAWRSRPVLNAQQIEDVIALLRTFRR